MLFLAIIFCLQLYKINTQVAIGHGFLKHLIPVKPIGPTDVHRQGFLPPPPQVRPFRPEHEQFFPHHPQQELMNLPYKPHFANEIGQPWLHYTSSGIQPAPPAGYQPQPLPGIQPQPPLGIQNQVLTNPSFLPGNTLGIYGISGNGPQFIDTMDSKFLDWALNRTRKRPLVLLITGNGSKKGKRDFQDVLLHVDLDDAEIRALKPDTLEDLNLFSPQESKWFRMMAMRVLKKFKSKYNLVLAPKPSITDLFERREEKLWSTDDSEPLRIDFQDLINPR